MRPGSQTYKLTFRPLFRLIIMSVQGSIVHSGKSKSVHTFQWSYGHGTAAEHAESPATCRNCLQSRKAMFG